MTTQNKSAVFLRVAAHLHGHLTPAWRAKLAEIKKQAKRG